MNKQRKVVITTTYNEMGIVIDTKAEEVVQPEVIRCKDCKHYLHDEEYGFDWCNRMSGVFRAKPDGFCSWADMRGGDK